MGQDPPDIKAQHTSWQVNILHLTILRGLSYCTYYLYFVSISSSIITITTIYYHHLVNIVFVVISTVWLCWLLIVPVGLNCSLIIFFLYLISQSFLYYRNSEGFLSHTNDIKSELWGKYSQFKTIHLHWDFWAFIFGIMNKSGNTFYKAHVYNAL